MISPVRRSVRPFVSLGPIISNAEIYCEDTFPGISSRPPASFFPRIFKGGKPSSPAYSISAPRLRKAFTSTSIGRCFIRSVPVMTCSSPSVTESRAVVKRIAVPAALMLIS